MPAVVEADEIFAELRCMNLRDGALGKLALGSQHFKFKIKVQHDSLQKGNKAAIRS